MWRMVTVIGLAGVTTTTGARGQAAAAPAARPSPVFYGGSMSIGFGSAFRIGVFPLIGVRVTPQLSVGSQVGYEYVNYDGPGGETSSYGGSLFARYRLAPQLYLHGEGRYVSYEWFDAAGASTRDWVPFLLLGGGFVQRLSPRTSAYAEALFDVLQDSKSPYDSGEPFLRFGVMVGY